MMIDFDTEFEWGGEEAGRHCGVLGFSGGRMYLLRLNGCCGGLMFRGVVRRSRSTVGARHTSTEALAARK
jgi:hypothetical protein